MKISIPLACILAVLPAYRVTAQPGLRPSPELAFTIPGQGDKLLSQYRGKVVALEFILTTCPHCQAQTKLMNGLEERYAARGFQALAVAVDLNADLRVENFSNEYQVQFPVGWTTIERMMSYMGFTERPVVPQLVLIDRAGIIHYATPREGDADSLKEDVIAKRIEELLRLNNSAATRSVRPASARALRTHQ